jgi:rod shape determining protein RodA
MPKHSLNRNPIASVDWVLLSMLLALMSIGWVMIYAAGFGQGYPDSLSDWLFKTSVGKQTLFIAISLGLLLCTLVIDHRFWRNGAFIIYGLTLLLLLGVLIFGKEVKGARSWYGIFGFSLQPSEFAKFGATLAVASFLAGYRGQVRNIQTWAIAIGFFVVPAALILIQPDAGSALVFSGLLLILYRAGLNASLFVLAFGAATLLILGFVFPPSRIGLLLLGFSLLVLAFQFEKTRWYFMLGIIGLGVAVHFYLQQGSMWYLPLALAITAFIGLGAFWYTKRKASLVGGLTAFVLGGTALAAISNFLFNSLAPHQQDRINVWLQPSKCDPRGSLYNVLQSKMAIGSGGWQGKGFLDGTLTKLQYVPEQTTDFIFCTVGEEHGFIGAFFVIGLFVALLLRLVSLAERQRSLFAQYYMYGVAGILFIHFLTNIGMTMGLMPIIGIPLPFISYGGSSLIAFTLIMGVALRLDATRAERE